VFFWPKTIENRAALRTAFAALAAVLFSFKFHLESPFWSGMTVVIISNLYIGNIIDKAILRVIGTVAGAFLGFYIAGLVANSFLLYLLSCFLILSMGSYYYSFSVNGYAYLLGALCAFIIISQIAIDPQNAFIVAIWRPVEIGIGVLISAISAYFIFPNHLKDNVSLQVHDIFTDFSGEFNQLVSILLQENADFTVLAQSNLKIKKKLRKAAELIGAMNYELGVSKARVDELRALFDIFYDLSRQLHYLILISPQHHDLTTIHSLSLESVARAIQDDLTQLQTAFSSQLETPILLKMGTAITELEKHASQKCNLDTVKRSTTETDYPTNTPFEQGGLIQSNFIHAFIHFLHQINRSFMLMHGLFTRLPLEITSTFQVIKTQERLRTDADIIKRCIKTGVSTLLALGFWLISNWPGGLNGIVSSLVISIRKNLVEMKNISFHRLLGCVIGGGIAIISLSLFEMTLYDFILIFFFSIWGFSYLMFKLPKYSYIGLQANVALIIALAQEGGPPTYLAPAIQRLGGIIIGVVASFIVANLLWRSDVWTMLNRYLNKLYVYMSQNLKQVLLAPGKQKKTHDLANLFWHCRGLLESLADEPLNSDKESLLRHQTQRFEALVVIQATISHILLAIDKEKIEKMASSLGMDLSYYEREIWISFEQHDVIRGKKISHQLQNVLSQIDKNRIFTQGVGEDLRGFLAYLNALNQLVLRIH
jgi:uncharacterized membrane protein YccC